MPLQRACFGDTQDIRGCSWWFLVRLWPGTGYEELMVFLCGHVSPVIYEGVCWSTCARPTGSLLVFFGFFTRPFSFASERLEEGEDMFKASCGASS